MCTSRKAFTLIELLVVIAIIAILASILFPVFAQAKAAAKKTTGLSNVKQQLLGLMMYANDADDKLICQWPFSGYPAWNGPGQAFNGDHTFHPFINPYIKNQGIWKDPGAGSEVYVSQNVYGTSDPFGSNPSLTGGYSMGYMMNESGWSDNNFSNLNNFLGSGINMGVLTHPAEQIILMEAAGLPEWVGNGYQIGYTTDGGLSTITQPSNPNTTLKWTNFYNVPGCDWGSAGFPLVEPYRYGPPGNTVGFFDGHVKFAITVQLKNVQPYTYNFDNTATNW
ncbi:MAG: prepilin-type N-terminal cleavage/methylation domain-containing protein [Fimbriimonas sp.]|nr:prepilin-type N-terminal cleavage/methylation domain-containing protein [Fimbriimonas sp.]